MWELDHKESWVLKSWCFWTKVLEKALENPLDSKEIQPVNPKENQSWTFTERTDAEAEAPILWLPDVKNWLLGKDPDSGKDWRHEKGMTEDEIVGLHHWVHRQEFEQALGAGDGHGSLVCCSPWSCKEVDTAEHRNWTEQFWVQKLRVPFWYKLRCLLDIQVEILKRQLNICSSGKRSGVETVDSHSHICIDKLGCVGMGVELRPEPWVSPTFGGEGSNKRVR